MSDTSIFEIDNMDVDLKQYVKIRAKSALNDSVIFKFLVYNDSSPVDLSNYNIEMRARLPKSGTIYSEVDNITKSGNVLTINCDSILCSEIGEVTITLRLWDNVTYQQKSNYIIVLKVMATIDEDENIATQSTLSALNSLDYAIDRYLELKIDLLDAIDDANTALTNLNTGITNANTTISNVNTAINNANTTKQALDTSNSTALSTKSAVDTSIVNAGTAKSNLEATITNSNNTKTQLQTVDTNAQTTKTGLQSLVDTADQKLQDFKNFDTNQIVVKTNQMYDELFPINDLVTINHNLGINPLVQFIIVEDGYGMGTYGTSYYGGIAKCHLGTYEVQYVNTNSLKIVVSNNYYKANPITTKVNDYEYTVTFAGYTDSMTIKLLV